MYMSTPSSELKDRLKSNQERLKSLKEEIISPDDIPTLDKKRKEKEDHLKHYKAKFFESSYTREVELTLNGIKDIDLEIVRKTKIKELIEDIKRDEEILSAKPLEERSLPTGFDSATVDHYLKLFEKLQNPVTPKVEFINITMVGEAGAGKSSFLNTVATALEKSNCIKDTYRVSPVKGRENSATKTVELEYLLLRGEEPLYIRFYDIPGIATKNDVGVEELLMFIKGEVKTGAKMVKASEMMKNKDIINEKPTVGDQIHCILYVVKASSNLSLNLSRSLEKMHRIRQKLLDEKVRQFVLVTHIDEIGVPNDNMKNASELPCTTSICQKVGTIFDLDEYHIIPMSSYFSETCPNIAKNIMALSALWRVCQSGRSYIREQLEKKPHLPGFRNK